MKRRIDYNAPLTIEELNEGLQIASRLVVTYGEDMLPLFERFERELAEAKIRASAVDRARATLARQNSLTEDTPMTDKPNLIELLSNLEAALEDHSFALHTARRPSMATEERLAVIRASGEAWQRLVIARRAVDEAAGTETVGG